MADLTTIYCCQCAADVEARLTDGREIYPHRPDLHEQPFWRCDTCRNYVGCHHKTQNPTHPLGVIPSEEVKNARRHIHRILDPIWQTGRLHRKHVYARLTEALGRQYHTGELRTVEECRTIYRAVQAIDRELRARNA
jgi:hypothetical protein